MLLRPRKRRKMTKRRVPLKQNHRLPKTPFSPPRVRFFTAEASRKIHMFLATIADRKRAASVGRREEKLQRLTLSCNLCGHLQRCQMPAIENSRKTAEKGGEAAKKQPEEQPKQSKQLFFRCFSCSSGWLFYRDPLGILFDCFLAVFNLGQLAPL